MLLGLQSPRITQTLLDGTSAVTSAQTAEWGICWEVMESANNAALAQTPGTGPLNYDESLMCLMPRYRHVLTTLVIRTP